MKHKLFTRVLIGIGAVSVVATALLFATPAFAQSNSTILGGAAGNEICEDINDVIKILDCGQKDVVSFMGFQGGLQAPTGEGLDPTLTRAKTAREFIVNTINFALAFLGVIALAVIIYGGFLYLTAAGNEEGATKGKKSVIYAVVGILIILVSFALVNTLLTFGGGSGTDRDGIGGVRGVRDEGSNRGQQAVYNFGASEINASLNEFVSAYKNLVSSMTIVDRIRALPAPRSRAENKRYLSNIIGLMNEIKNNNTALTKTGRAASRMLNEYLYPLQNTVDEVVRSRYELDGAGITQEDAIAAGAETGERNISSDLKEEILTALEKGGEVSGIEEREVEGFGLVNAIKADYIAAIDSLVGPENAAIDRRPTNDQNIQGRLPVIWKIMGNVADEINATTALERGLINGKDLERAFAGIDPNITVGGLFQDAIKQINGARSLAETTSSTDLIINAVKSLDRLYIVVKDIKFVFVKIKATTKEGSAPLIVELNGLDSRDPTGRTIPDGNYVWDPDGDGDDGVSSGGGNFPPVECTGDRGPTITCTYNKTGTYLVRLGIASQDPEHIASGQAFLAVTVSPSVARISLKAIIGSITEDVRSYVQDARGQWNLSVDKTELHVTTEEATKTGIGFDASKSKGGAGDDIKNFKWSFGDGSPIEEGADKTKILSHKYPREGKFPLTLEVTDRGNRKDRKLINVVISSIAGRIGASHTIGEPEELIEFDGSLSRSDRGSINSYSWGVFDSKGNDIINFKNDIEVIGDRASPVLRVKFKKPGSFAVSLKVSDGGATDETQIPIAIKSRRPRANFSVAQCPENCVDPSRPALIELDANTSFDPDPSDILTYSWSLYNALGEKLEPGTGFFVQGGAPLTGQQAKRLRIEFPAVGTYRAVLKVNDSHQDPNILQEDTREKEIKIPSIIEMRWSPAFQQVVPLKDGKAPFVFSGTVRNAERVSIDFGDDEVNEQTVALQSGSGTFKFEHDYSKAGSYIVSVRASDDKNGENTITKRVYAAAGDAPLAVMEVAVNNVGVVLPSPTVENPKPALEIIRNIPVTFDASQSLNSEGKPTGLSYSWDFGYKGCSPNPDCRSTGKIVQHSFKEVSPEETPFTVVLTVTEGEKTSRSEFFVRVASRAPQVNTLSLEKKTSGSVTPIEVKLAAEGASDPDGRITNYQFWYFDPADPDRKLSVVDTQSNFASLTVETEGEENDEHEYIFCVSVTDNENTTNDCKEMFHENELPRLRVKNGPNKAPVASFTVDRTSVKVNEPVTFTSSSRDEDSRITKYIWDIEGDGFQNNNETQLSTITHTYGRRNPVGGYRVKLKVIDDKNAAGYSKEIPIFVTANSNPPIANFTFTVQPSPTNRVAFFDTSTADTKNGARLTKWKWDFDTTKEFGCTQEPKPTFCNGDKTDDVDSDDQNPVFDFPRAGTYQVKLSVEDSDGNSSDAKTTLVKIIAGESGGTAGTPQSDVLRAELITTPAMSFESIPGCEPKTAVHCKRKVLHLPADSNGQPITLSWKQSTGDIVSYKVDKNIWCDSNKDGDRTNDVDNPDTVSGTCTVAETGGTASHCWTTNFGQFVKTGNPNGPGRFTPRLTVTDRTGASATDSLEIIFDGPTDPAKVAEFKQYDCDGKPANLLGATLGAALLQKLGAQKTIALGIVSGVVLVLIIIGLANILRRGKTRDV